MVSLMKGNGFPKRMQQKKKNRTRNETKALAIFFSFLFCACAKEADVCVADSLFSGPWDGRRDLPKDTRHSNKKDQM